MRVGSIRIALVALALGMSAVRAAPPPLDAQAPHPPAAVPSHEALVPPPAPPSAAAIDWAATREEAASLLARYVQVPSVTGQEAAAGQFLADIAHARGLSVQRLDGENGRPNVWITAGRAGGDPDLIMLGHLDVVPANAGEWTHPPFSGTRADGAVWGRGAIDNKGATVIDLVALELLRQVAPEYPFKIGLLAVSDEEVTGSGARWVLDHHGDLLGKAPVLGEGGAGISGMDPLPPGHTVYPVATAEKSSLWIELSLDLPASGHGAVPPAEYATRQMVMALQKLLSSRRPEHLVPQTRAMLETLARLVDFPRNFFLEHPDWPLIKHLLDRQLSANPLLGAMIRDTVTLTGIDVENGAGNVIPSHVVARLDCRLLPDTDENEFLAYLGKALGDGRIKMSIFHRSARAAASSPGALYTALAQAIAKTDPAGLMSPFLFPASSDGNSFRAAGHPVLGFMPCRLERGELEGIHGRDERIRDAALEEGIRATLETLLRLPAVTRSDLSGRGADAGPRAGSSR